MGELTYMTLLSVFIVLPMLSVILLNLKTIAKYKLVLLGALVILPVTMIWDYLATANNVWYFVNIMGVWVFGLPIEEIIFMASLILFVSSVTLIILKR